MITEIKNWRIGNEKFDVDYNPKTGESSVFINISTNGALSHIGDIIVDKGLEGRKLKSSLRREIVRRFRTGA